jgi:hypothetical protein
MVKPTFVECLILSMQRFAELLGSIKLDSILTCLALVGELAVIVQAIVAIASLMAT